MHIPSSRHRLWVLLVGIAVFALSGWAAADPPLRAARLGYISGAVSFSPAGENDWVQATLNRPLTTGDRIWADADSRAEVQVGGAALRMGASTSKTQSRGRKDGMCIRLPDIGARRETGQKPGRKHLRPRSDTSRGNVKPQQ